MALDCTQPLADMSSRISFLGVEHGRSVKLATSSPHMSEVCRQCSIRNMSHSYSPPQPITGIDLLIFHDIIIK
jgi:hypothetical protein